MILYVVELEMDASLRGEYLPWLRSHVAKMLALPGFLGAEILECREPRPPTGRWRVATHYRLLDHRALADYRARHAPRMRAASSVRIVVTEL